MLTATAAEVKDARHLRLAFEGRGKPGGFGFLEFAQGTLGGQQQRLPQIKAERAVELMGEFATLLANLGGEEVGGSWKLSPPQPTV